MGNSFFMREVKTKVCTTCKIEKEYSFFSIRKKTGYSSSECKSCINNRVKKYRELYPIKVKECQKKCYNNKRDYYLTKSKEDRINNKEHRNIIINNWRNKNKEKTSTYKEKYRIIHKQKIKERSKYLMEYHIQECSDCYIKATLRHCGFLNKDIDNELIELKKSIIKIKRLCKSKNL